jgi:hypothetical protein
MQLVTPWKDLLKEILQTWEDIKDGWIRAQVHGKKIVIDKVLIHEQLGISCEGIVNVVNATIQEAKFAMKRITSPNVFVENE